VVVVIGGIGCGAGACCFVCGGDLSRRRRRLARQQSTKQMITRRIIRKAAIGTTITIMRNESGSDFDEEAVGDSVEFPSDEDGELIAVEDGPTVVSWLLLLLSVVVCLH
jgi:hypothetical protein